MMFFRIKKQERAKAYLFTIVLFAAFSPSLAATALSNFLPLLVVAPSALVLFDFGISKRPNPLAFYFGLCLTLTITLSLFGEAEPRSILISIIRFATLGILSLAVYRLAEMLRANDIIAALKVVVVGNLLLLVLVNLSNTIAEISFILFYNNPQYDDWFGYFVTRYSGTFGNPNTLGITMALLAPVFLISDVRKLRIVFFFGALVLIWVSLSRTSFVILVSFLTLYIMSGRLSLINVAVLFGGLVLGRTLWSSEILIVSRMLERLSNRSLGGRLELWTELFNSLTDAQIIFGSGTMSHLADTVDSEYLNVLVQFGFLGLAAFVLTLVYPLFLGVYVFLKNRSVLAGVLVHLSLGTMIASAAASPLASLKLSFFLVILLSFFLPIVQKKTSLGLSGQYVNLP